MRPLICCSVSQQRLEKARRRVVEHRSSVRGFQRTGPWAKLILHGQILFSVLSAINSQWACQDRTWCKVEAMAPVRLVPACSCSSVLATVEPWRRYDKVTVTFITSKMTYFKHHQKVSTRKACLCKVMTSPKPTVLVTFQKERVRWILPACCVHIHKAQFMSARNLFSKPAKTTTTASDVQIQLSAMSQLASRTHTRIHPVGSW